MKSESIFLIILMIFRLKKVVWLRLVNGCENSGQPQKGSHCDR